MKGFFSELSTVFWLSIRDYMHEWQMSICFVLALAAVLAPMLVLFGLKFGIVNNMTDRLLQDPRNREIKAIGSGRYELDWFEKMGARDDVAFITPFTRSIAATMDVQNTDDRPTKILKLEMIPTGRNDPLLKGIQRVPEKTSEIVLSEIAAHKLGIKPGDQVSGSVTRVYLEQHEREHIPLEVVAVAHASSFKREGAFVSLELLTSIEDYKDGREVPEYGWAGSHQESNHLIFPGFRLYASTLDDVIPLRDALVDYGIDVRTRGTDIEIVKSLDRNLSVVFWIIATVALAGFALSLGASLWANVDRKKRELSVMRLVGFRTAGIMYLPVIQALLTGVLGWLIACLIYYGVERVLNRTFSPNIDFGQNICVLLPEHIGGALVITLFSCFIASALGGFQVSRVEPSEGIREV